jgi:hypothetical protein
MNTFSLRIPDLRPFVLLLPMLVGFVASSLAQEVSIPDPALNTAVREALGKPAGPLTQLDMLSLTNFGAIFRNMEIPGISWLQEGKHLSEA